MNRPQRRSEEIGSPVRPLGPRYQFVDSAFATRPTNSSPKITFPAMRYISSGFPVALLPRGASPV
jgi:hypothetical protein